MTVLPAPPRVQVVIGPDGLDELFAALSAEDYEVLGPTVRDGSIVIGPITSSAHLPRGFGDTQEPGRYRLVEREDDAYFGFATPAGTWKQFLFPPRSVLWRSRLEDGRVIFEEVPQGPAKRAFLGIRACDLAAIAVQDRVFLDGECTEPVYAGRRDGLFLIGVNCGDPAATCFCASMGTGPSVQDGADLVLTELEASDPVRHRFLVDAVSEHGRAVAEQLTSVAAVLTDVEAAEAVTQSAVSHMQRSMNTADLPLLLRNAANHPRWDDVASRCLSCGNCTMACPTCFCADVADEPNAATGVDERVREWSSCFQLSHSYLHGGSLRVSTKSRYRQWMTHKLSTWWDQFGMSGCVGCGRCIAWCPVGIDITEEVRAIRGNEEAALEKEDAS